jgi:hypothetical protein
MEIALLPPPRRERTPTFIAGVNSPVMVMPGSRPLPPRSSTGNRRRHEVHDNARRSGWCKHRASRAESLARRAKRATAQPARPTFSRGPPRREPRPRSSDVENEHRPLVAPKPARPTMQYSPNIPLPSMFSTWRFGPTTRQYRVHPRKIATRLGRGSNGHARDNPGPARKSLTRTASDGLALRH